MDITPAGVSAGLTGAGIVITLVASWLRGIDRSQESRIVEIKTTQKTLFERHDTVTRDLQSYKLHVAETYVNREILKEQLAPINKVLDSIQQELRDDRKR